MVSDIILKFNSKISVGVDHVSKCFVKNATPVLVSVKEEIFNKLLFGAAGIPRYWLTVTRIFLHERGDTYD